MRLTVPSAMAEIITGIILAAGRIFGEAAAFLYTAGLSSKTLNFNSISLTGNSAFSLFRPAETLAVHIWKLNSEGIVVDAVQIANGTAAVLIIAVLLFNVIAKLIGNEKASRAVGMANNKNPIMIIIPCHRVIGVNGKLVGYAGGLDVKEKLLNMEKNHEIS